MAYVSFAKLFWWMSLDLTDDNSTLVAPNHYLSQCWPRSVSQYNITRPQWVNFKSQLDLVSISNHLCKFSVPYLSHFTRHSGLSQVTWTTLEQTICSAGDGSLTSPCISINAFGHYWLKLQNDSPFGSLDNDTIRFGDAIHVSYWWMKWWLCFALILWHIPQNITYANIKRYIMMLIKATQDSSSRQLRSLGL